MINSKNLQDLEPKFLLKVEAWLSECRQIGLSILVVSTYRDDEMQNWMYASGRTRDGKVITNAKAGQSKHNVRKALDYCIMHGKTCAWDDIQGFTRAGLLAERHGMVWAGRWNGKLKELGHIEAVF